MAKITKSSKIGDVLQASPKAEEILFGFGMHCFHCPMSQNETLEEAAAAHGVDIDLMIQKLNEGVK